MFISGSMANWMDEEKESTWKCLKSFEVAIIIRVTCSSLNSCRHKTKAWQKGKGFVECSKVSQTNVLQNTHYTVTNIVCNLLASLLWSHIYESSGKVRALYTPHLPYEWNIFLPC